MAVKHLLLVEGPDDHHVIKALLGERRQVVPLEIQQNGGVEALLKSFPVQLKLNSDAVIGVVIDADTDLSARWKAIRNVLTKAGYGDVPTNPLPSGTIVEPPPGALLPKVGIWLMPDNTVPGILEDFIKLLVPANSPLFERVRQSVDSIPESECKFSEVTRPKAIIHTWLAWQKEPGKPLGQAITAKYLDATSIHAEPFVNWLNRLYGAVSPN